MALSKEELESMKKEGHKADHTETKETKPKNNKKLLLVSISSLVIVLIVVGVGFSFVNSKKPAALDGFAKCLTEKGAVMYGATWCKYTSAQKGMFGNSIKFVNYQDFSKNSEVKITPTWFIDDNKYENVQSLDKLSSITGCVIGK